MQVAHTSLHFGLPQPQTITDNEDTAERHRTSRQHWVQISKRRGRDEYHIVKESPEKIFPDYAQLETIYAHLDTNTTVGAAPAGFENADSHAQENWGTKVRESADGRSAIFVRDFG